MTNKEKYIELLKATKRDGIDNLIERLEKDGFFTAPCSTRYHLSKEGGLLEHSLNVYDIATRLKKALNSDLPQESIALATLLHDIGKMGRYGKPMYIPSPPLKNGGTPATPYQYNKELMNFPHEVLSADIAREYIELTEDEYFAILMHNGKYGCFYKEIDGHETELYLITHSADMFASRVTEVEK